MSEGFEFTIYPSDKGSLVVANGSLAGVALNPSFRGNNGEDTTGRLIEYLENMLAMRNEQGQPLFVLNPANKVKVSRKAAPVIGEEWILGKDDRLVINQISLTPSKSGDKLVYGFFTESLDYVVVRANEDDVPANHPILSKVGNRPLFGEWYLTVIPKGLKKDEKTKEDKNPNWISSYFVDFVSIEPVNAPSHNEPPTRPAQPRQQTKPTQAQAAPRGEPLAPLELQARFDGALVNLAAFQKANPSKGYPDYSGNTIQNLMEKSGLPRDTVQAFVDSITGETLFISKENAYALYKLAYAEQGCLAQEIEDYLAI